MDSGLAPKGARPGMTGEKPRALLHARHSLALDAAGQYSAMVPGSTPAERALTPELQQKLTLWRRHLHAHPELSLQEQETSAFVQEKLTELGIPFEAGIGGHGIVATLTRGDAQSRVGLRADMDALPITEQTGLPYASKHPGVMHACGHD